MALWFSASAVIPALVAEFRLSGFAQAALTSGVQAGFVIGCLGERVFRARRSARSASALRGVRGHRRARQCAAARRRPDVDRRAGAARRHRRMHGGRLSGRHEARVDVGEGRHGADGRHPGRRADARLRVAVSLQRDRRIRLASAAADRVRMRTGGGGADRIRRHRTEPGARAAVRSARRVVGVARRAAAARQSRLSRPHVGALRDVGVDRRVLQRELRADAAGGDGTDRGQAGGVRHHRRRRDRLGRRGAARRPPRPHDAHHRRDGGQRHLRRDDRLPFRRRSAVARRCWASSGASASSPIRRSSRRRSPSSPIASGSARC